MATLEDFIIGQLFSVVHIIRLILSEMVNPKSFIIYDLSTPSTYFMTAAYSSLLRGP